MREKVLSHHAYVLQCGEARHTPHPGWSVVRHKHFWTQYAYLKKNLVICSDQLKSDSVLRLSDPRLDRILNMNNLTTRFNPTHLSLISRSYEI
jgi:hypothetical protein